ncbi:hypothetical protein BN2475_470184 [Paraburkholderia ribeironis]|uniref:Uncharacterized protein n=1 Tax=Paraburkholderia ribeironis TaxID=1247936 RepID=A0A1N7SAN0_9BURK|nr:hypothetical protein BN2475_470184 [Paraburkholderia ribeironis]
MHKRDATNGQQVEHKRHTSGAQTARQGEAVHEAKRKSRPKTKKPPSKLRRFFFRTLN